MGQCNFVALNLLILLILIDGFNSVKPLAAKSKKHRYKLVYEAKTWLDARDSCASRCTKLAVPESQEEFEAVQGYVRNMKYSKVKNADYRLIAWVGLSSLGEQNEWRTITGKSINDTGFSIFSSAVESSANPAEPHCAGVDAVNLGYRDWWCHQRLPYICQS